MAEVWIRQLPLPTRKIRYCSEQESQHVKMRKPALTSHAWKHEGMHLQVL